MSIGQEIFKTEARIMTLEQDIFYKKEELESLKSKLNNMRKIQERQSND